MNGKKKRWQSDEPSQTQTQEQEAPAPELSPEEQRALAPEPPQPTGHWVLQSLFNDDGIRIAYYARESKQNLWEIYDHVNQLMGVAENQEAAKKFCDRYALNKRPPSWYEE